TQIGEIKVKSSDGKYSLQTLAIDGDGRILALAGPPRSYGAPVKNASAEVQVFTADRKLAKSWKVDFHATAINACPDGVIFVAGEGKVASFDRDGKPLATV